MEYNLNYKDVLLIPKYSELPSRSLADTRASFCDFLFNLPVVPSNMQDVINEDVAKELSESGYFYIMHRFNPPELREIIASGQLQQDVTYKLVCMANLLDLPLISISTGVNEDTQKILSLIKSESYRVDFITIDVAHGHHIKVAKRIEYIKKNFPETKVIAGNVATYEGYRFLVKAGADAVKVGIGSGRICSTKMKTGFSMPMFSCVQNIVSQNAYFMHPQIPIIADGGIEDIGDINKALVAGADMVMCGGLFASCSDSPAKKVGNKKLYRGSTSYEATQSKSNVEGFAIELDSSSTINQRMQEIRDGIASGISYAGGKDLKCFKNSDWIVCK
jgi:GMP reductase